MSTSATEQLKKSLDLYQSKTAEAKKIRDAAIKQIKDQDVLKMLTSYTNGYDLLNDQYDQIKAHRDETFKLTKELDKSKNSKDHEDLMFRTSELKNLTADLHKFANDLGVDLKGDVEFFEAGIKLGRADNLLKDKGFLKITETIRSVAMDSLIEVREMRRVLGKVRSLSMALLNLFESLKMDETNFRTGARHEHGRNGYI